jgi:hypothetical protein
MHLHGQALVLNISPAMICLPNSLIIQELVIFRADAAAGKYWWLPLLATTTDDRVGGAGKFGSNGRTVSRVPAVLDDLAGDTEECYKIYGPFSRSTLNLIEESAKGKSLGKRHGIVAIEHLNSCFIYQRQRLLVTQKNPRNKFRCH